MPPGVHDVRISNASTDPQRDMVYMDGFVITGGDILTPAGHTTHETLGVVLGTALKGVDTVNAFILEPAAEALEFVVEVVAGTTVAIVDPSGRTLARATVDEGGVLDIEALPSGGGTYALVLHNGAAADSAFEVWEMVTETR